MINDFGYIEKTVANIREVTEKQEANIKAAYLKKYRPLVRCL